MYGTHKENAGGFEKNSIWFFYGMMSAKRSMIKGNPITSDIKKLDTNQTHHQNRNIHQQRLSSYEDQSIK